MEHHHLHYYLNTEIKRDLRKRTLKKWSIILWSLEKL